MVENTNPIIKTKDIGELEMYLLDDAHKSADELLRMVVERKGYLQRVEFKGLKVFASTEIGDSWQLVRAYDDGEVFKWQKIDSSETVTVRDFGYKIHCRERPGFYDFFFEEDLTK